MRLLLAIILAVTVLTGCSPYPRYRPDGMNVPERQGPSDGLLKTDEVIRLGMIMQSYLGVPYGEGADLATPIDCSLFTQEVFKRFNRTRLPRTSADQYKVGRAVATRRLHYGDLVFFRTDGPKVSHVGIYIGSNEFIHTSTSRGVIISNLGEEYWSRRYAGARRVLTTTEQ